MNTVLAEEDLERCHASISRRAPGRRNSERRDSAGAERTRREFLDEFNPLHDDMCRSIPPRRLHPIDVISIIGNAVPIVVADKDITGLAISAR